MNIRRTFLSAALVASLALPLYAQRVPMRQGPRMGMRLQQGLAGNQDRRATAQNAVINAVKEALQLTDAQVAGLRTLMTSRQQAVQSIALEAQTGNQTLRNLMAQPNPNPAELGNAMLALRQVRQARQQAQTNFATGFENLLTPAQKDRYNALKSAAGSIGPLARLGLLGRQSGRMGRR